MILERAKISDVEYVFELINYYADKGLVLPRSRQSLWENLHALRVLRIDAEVKGCALLQILGSDLVEIRSLAITEELRGCGYGKKIVQELEEEAKKLGIPKIFTLTYQVDFFKSCSYKIIDKETMPQKVWKDCINCLKFPTCDEVAMLKVFNA